MLGNWANQVAQEQIITTTKMITRKTLNLEIAWAIGLTVVVSGAGTTCVGCASSPNPGIRSGTMVRHGVCHCFVRCKITMVFVLVLASPGTVEVDTIA